MKKGLLTTLLAAAASISGIQAVYATAPTVRPLPDIQIGDIENNGTTDNNYFVYTNAFRLDDKASDDTIPANGLLWSFTEGAYASGAIQDSAQQWFQINGKNPLSVGDSNQAAGAALATRPDQVPNGVPVGTGGSKNLREVSDYATFRDIVLSPGWGPLTTGFPTQHAVAQDHARGKFVTFYVSDGQNVGSRSIVVRSVDNQGDVATEAAAYQPKRIDYFTTGPVWWQKFDPNDSRLSYDSGTGSLRAFVPTGAFQRVSGWRESEYIVENFFKSPPGQSNELKYNEVGSANWIRAKFHLFAQDANGGSNVTDVSKIPNFRLRISGAIFAFASFLDLQHHDTPDTVSGPLSHDMAPTTSSANARVYRVDMDPPEIPSYTQNTGTFNRHNLGFVRMYETYGEAQEPQENGYLCLAESSIGIYEAPKPADFVTKVVFDKPGDWQTPADNNNFGLAPGNTYTLGQVYGLSSAGVGALMKGSRNGQQEGPAQATEVVFTRTATGFEMSTVAVDNIQDTDGMGHMGIAAVDWLGGNIAGETLRAEPNLMYRARFTATSTVASSVNAQLRFRVSTIGFQFNPRLEVGGANSGEPFNAEYLPGTGSAWSNGTTNNNTYDLIFMTPFSINPTEMEKTSGNHLGAVPATVQANKPHPYYRQLHPGVDIIDEYISDPSKTSTKAKGHVKISRIELQEFPMVGE